MDRTVGNTFKGGAGMDIVDYRRAGAGVNVVLGDGVESSTRDVFESIEGLTGSAFDDTLNGSTGNDYLDGGQGDDILNGRPGHDIVDYLLATSAIAIDLRNEVQEPPSRVDTARTRFTSIEGVRGTIRADSIWGNDAGNTLIGLIGADKLHGLDGADTLDGGEDNDTLEGGEAPSLYGGQAPIDIGGEDHDTFVFATTEEVAGDVIADFNDSQDVLDLSKIDAINGRRRRCLLVDHHDQVRVPRPYLLPGLCATISATESSTVSSEMPAPAQLPISRSRLGSASSGARTATSCSERRRPIAAGPDQAATPSFFCRLVEDVVYWNRSFFSGYT